MRSRLVFQTASPQCGALLCPFSQCQTVAKAKDDALHNRLVDFLVGEEDGIAKVGTLLRLVHASVAHWPLSQDPHHMFKLCIALKNYEKAINTALHISNQEREEVCSGKGAGGNCNSDNLVSFYRATTRSLTTFYLKLISNLKGRRSRSALTCSTT